MSKDKISTIIFIAAGEHISTKRKRNNMSKSFLLSICYDAGVGTL